MSRRTWMTALAATVILSLAAVPMVSAGNGGGRQGGGKSTGSQQRGGGQSSDQPRSSGNGSRVRLEATQQQQQQVRTCTEAAEQVRRQAREIVKSARGTGPAGESPPQQHRLLQDRVRTMEQEHNRLMQSLNEQQRAQLQDRIRQMTAARNRVQSEMERLGPLMEGGDPDPARVRDHAREVERASKTWEKQYRRIESEMTS